MIRYALSDLRLSLATVLVATAASTAVARQETAPEPTGFSLRGQELLIWPADDLRSRGMSLVDIPRAENAAWLYLEAANTYKDLPEDIAAAFDHAVSDAWPPGHPALQAYLTGAESTKAIELIHRASGMSSCQMPYFGKPTDSIIAVLMPSMSHMRFLAKLLVADGRRLEAEGRYDEAAGRYITCMQMGIHAAGGFTLIESLVGVAIWQLGNRALLDLVTYNELPERQMRKLATDFARLAPRTPAADRGLQGEQSFGPAIVDEIFSRPFLSISNLGGILSFTTFSGAPTWSGEPDLNINPQDGWSRFEKRLGQVIYPDRAIKQHMREFYGKQQVLAERPMSAEALAFDEEKFINERIPRWDVISRAMLPSLSRAIHLGLRARANASLGEAVIAIRRYQLAHESAAPAGLADLKELVSPGALLDPFTGESLRYRQDDEGWVVYSLGPNMTDEGGTESETQRWDKFDIAFRFPREPRKVLPPAEPDSN